MIGTKKTSQLSLLQILLLAIFILQLSGCNNGPIEEEKINRPIPDPAPADADLVDTSVYRPPALPAEVPVTVIPEQDPNGIFWGLRDTVSHKLILDYTYQKIWEFKEGFATVMLNDKFGIIDKKGKQIVEPVYDFPKSEMKCGYAVMEHGYGPLAIFDSSGRTRLPLLSSVSDILPCQQRFTIRRNLVGMMNFDGDTILPFVFTSAYFVSERFCAAEKPEKNDQKRLYGLYDLNGKKVLPHVYESIDGFYSGRSIAKRNGKLCLIAENGKEIAATEYVRIDRFRKGYAVVYKSIKADDIRVGIIDRSGREIVPPVYLWLDNVYNFNEGMVPVTRAQDRKYGFIDSTGKIAIPYIYEKVESFENGIAKVWKDWHHVGYIDKKGKEIIPAEFDPMDQMNLRRYYNKYIIGLKDSVYHIFDYKGKELRTLNYKYFSAFDEKEKSFTFYENNKCGTLDSNLQILIPPTYESLQNVFVDIAASRNGKIGFIDHKGKVLTAFKYDEIFVYPTAFANDYENGLILVKIGPKIGLMNLHRKLIVPVIYDEIQQFYNGLAIVIRNGKYGFVDKRGKEVVPAIYNSAGPYNGYTAEVSLNDETFMVDNKGKRVEEDYD